MSLMTNERVGLIHKLYYIFDIYLGPPETGLLDPKASALLYNVFIGFRI
jgi:hypothetical protein